MLLQAVNLYGTHTFFTALDADGNMFGTLILNSNAQGEWLGNRTKKFIESQSVILYTGARSKASFRRQLGGNSAQTSDGWD